VALTNEEYEMATLINKHGRPVSVSKSRVKELLQKGFRYPDESDFERAAERSAQLREVLTKVSKAVEAEDEGAGAPEPTGEPETVQEEQTDTAPEVQPEPAQDEPEVKEQPTVKEQIAELLQSGKKPDLEQALTAAGLKPEDYLTNNDRKAALQEFLGAKG
jgi:hypothetical protein